MTDAVVHVGKVRTRSAGQILRWLGTGVLTLVGMSLVGGLLVGLFAGGSITSNADAERCAKAVRVFDLLLVTPLAIGVAAALAVAVPTARVLRARRTNPVPGKRRPGLRNAMTVATAVKCGFIAAALFWSVSGLVVPRTSIMAAHWVNGDSADQLHQYFYGFKLPSVENWSIIESIGLSLLLVVVACVAGWRYAPREGRPSTRRVLTTATAMTVLLAGAFTWHAAREYHDVTTMAAGSARHTTTGS